jgi:hypothetical protein
MNQQNKGIKSNIKSRIDDIFDRMLSIKLDGHVDLQLDFNALRKANSSSCPSRQGKHWSLFCKKRASSSAVASLSKIRVISLRQSDEWEQCVFMIFLTSILKK